MFRAQDFFNLDQEPLAFLFENTDKVWDVLRDLEELIKDLVKPEIHGNIHESAYLEGPVYLGPGSVIGPHAYIKGPVYIGANSEVRHGAYIRPNSIIGDHCIVGHATELKSSILLSHAQAPHFAYVGDSVLGRGVNLGAGTKLANFKLGANEVQLLYQGERISTGLRKFGAILGDGVSIGCNAVTAPGTVVGKNTWIYSSVSLRGYIGPEKIVKYDYSTVQIVDKV
ncbi:MAG: glucose-1-phosphate thymidylyltransferase [Firmicutes bacterium]|jgi:NDP-sugar pyrophosphorylase family protein|nr:glucose-1-phosphate thymidylyltransferase [Bacillota bacterium]